MEIKGIHKTSLVDFPGRISTILFAGGCNLNCRYCYNPELVNNSNSLKSESLEDILTFLKKRHGLIDGVVISGGEPTLHKDIKDLINTIKDVPLLVKIDTNGLNPKIIKELLENNIVDYIAIDIKTSPEKYSSLTRKRVDFSRIKSTIEIAKESGIDYELRTTCIPDFVTSEDLQKIKDQVGQVKKYYLQQFVNEITIDTSFKELDPYPVSVLKEFREFVKTFSEICEIRGV